MKYRGSVGIRGQILQVANGFNATKAKIMYQAFLGYKQLEEHLSFLTEKCLLYYDGNTQTFRTTEKGLRFLELYNHIEAMIKYELKNNYNNNERIEADKEEGR